MPILYSQAMLALVQATDRDRVPDEDERSTCDRLFADLWAHISAYFGYVAVPASHTKLLLV